MPVSPTTAVKIDAYVIDTLMADLVGHDHRASAFVVYLYLWRQSSATRHTVSLSLRTIAESTGLSKRAVQDALGLLVRRRLIATKRESVTAIPSYQVQRPWLRTARRT